MIYYFREFTGEQRDRLAKQGKAMDDGSFPIVNVDDLRNAIQAIGRAKNPAAAKRHIIRRARALGRTDLLPDDWKVKVTAAYGSTADLPDAVKSNYSARCQSVFMRVFNHTVQHGGAEDEAFGNAHVAAKNCMENT